MERKQGYKSCKNCGMNVNNKSHIVGVNANGELIYACEQCVFEEVQNAED